MTTPNTSRRSANSASCRSEVDSSWQPKVETISRIETASSGSGPMSKTRSETLCASNRVRYVAAMDFLKWRILGGRKWARCFARLQNLRQLGYQHHWSERLLQERAIEIRLIAGIPRDV